MIPTVAETQVLDMLRNGGSLTAAQQLNMFGYMRGMLLKLFPTNYEKEISIDRLGPNVVTPAYRDRYMFYPRDMTVTGDCWLTYVEPMGLWRLPSRQWLPKCVAPRNLGEAWELMNRCGVEPFICTTTEEERKKHG